MKAAPLSITRLLLFAFAGVVAAVVCTHQAAGAAPVFTGSIPDLTVDAGSENLSAFDFGPLFSDPDGQPLTYSLVYPPDLLSCLPGYPVRSFSWGLSINLTGTHIDLSSNDSEMWGHSGAVQIQASDGGSYGRSNAFNYTITAPPVAARTWISLLGDRGAYTQNGSSRGCGGWTAMIGSLLFPHDATIAEYSFVVWREPIPPSEPDPPNGSYTPPPPPPYATGGRYLATIDGQEILNESIGEFPARVFVNTTAINAHLANATGRAGMGSFTLVFSACMEGGEAWLHAEDPRYWVLRMPPGSGASELDPHAPGLSGLLPDINITVGDSAGAGLDLSQFFSDADGDPVLFLAPATELQLLARANLTITLRGNRVDVAAAANATPGEHSLNLTARDPFGKLAPWGRVTIRLVEANASHNPTGTGGGGEPPAQPIPSTAGAVTAVQATVVVTGVAVAVALVTVESLRYTIVAALFGAFAAGRRRPSPLAHFVRGQLYQLIMDNPGIHYSELLRRAQLANGTASHHLRVLVNGGYVRAVRDGTKTRFTATGQKPNESEYGLSQRDLKVLEAVSERPGIPQEDLAAAIGMSRSRVSRAVRRLSLLGLVRADRSGRTALLYPRHEPDLAGGAGFAGSEG